MRHTSATLLLIDGTNLKTVASRLGHSQLSTTNRYLHALSEAEKAAAESFQNLVLISVEPAKEQKNSG